ncbi:MAG: hypothetical protein KGJ66_07070 [Alphaproteobacteria bacterium]|nr:hypothetical protein [Alphaproteobacteria bacterium]
MDEELGDVGAVYDELQNFFDDFQVEFRAATNGLTLHFDRPVITNVAQSYIYDLARYSKFHEIEIPDLARRAGYLAKWLLRLRPVRCDADVTAMPEEIGKLALTVNELFALYVVSGILRIDLEARLTPRTLNMVLYSFRYRATSEDAFFLFFVHLSESA